MARFGPHKLKMRDNEPIVLGDGDDVEIKWDGTEFSIDSASGFNWQLSKDTSFAIGDFAGSAATGSGFVLSGTQTGAMNVFAEVTSDLTSAYLVRAIRGRTLVNFAGTSEAEVFGLQGQLVVKQTVMAHDNAGVLGSFEVQGTHAHINGTTGDNCTAAVLGRVGVTVTGTTVDADGILAGVAAMSNVTDGYVTVSGGGIWSGFYVGGYTSGGARQVFDYGLYIGASKATTGIGIAACTTGMLISGNTTTGISITGNATDAIKIATGTITDAIEVAAGTNGLNISGAVTKGVIVAGGATDGVYISGGSITDAIEIGASTNAINISGAVTTGVLVAGTATTGVSVTGTTTTGVSVSGASTTGVSITGNATTGLAMTTGTFTKLMDLDHSAAGGDSAQAIDVDVAVLAGTSGYRQGALNISMTRQAGQEFAATWDGNGDTAIKVLSRNYGNNLDGATRIGGAQALNIQARNSGTNLSWVYTLELNARNDSSKNVSELRGAHIRMENYGNIYTSNTGLDVEMSDENTTQSQVRTGILIRSTDLSGMSAVNNVFKISHTSTNGFTNLFYFNAATGDTFSTGELTDNASADVNCDGYITCSVNGTPYYVPMYDTKK